MKIPKILKNYIDETGDSVDKMTPAELFETAGYLLAMIEAGDYGDGCSRSDVSALRSYRTQISCRMVARHA